MAGHTYTNVKKGRGNVMVFLWHEDSIIIKKMANVEKFFRGRGGENIPCASRTRYILRPNDIVHLNR